MDKNHTYNNRETMQDDDNRLELLLSSCHPEDIDSTRIKQLVHARIIGEKLARRRGMRRLLWMCGSIAACLAVIATVVYKYNVQSAVDLFSATLAEIDGAGYKELVVTQGKRMELVLPDGSQLIANSHTRVLYPEKFEGAERRIYVDGEVFLHVTKDSAHPFIVESRGFEVKVLGTTFDICNTSDSTAHVVLIEGAVEVSTSNDNRIKLRPNDLVDVVNGDIESLRQVDAQEYILWVNGLMRLRGEPFAELAAKLGKHYGVNINCDNDIAGVKVYGKLDLSDSIDDVLKSIMEIIPMEIEREGDIITMKSKD